MTIEELYTEVGGSYGSVKKALLSDRIIEKYVLRFREITCFSELSTQIAARQQEGSFRAVHALKGICQNIGFLNLQRSASELTELLRPENGLHPTMEQMDKLFAQVKEDYTQALAVVERYAAEKQSA